MKSYTWSSASGRNTIEGNIVSSMSVENGIGIRIAKIKKKRCGGETVTCICCCGVGFRCGITSFGEENGDDVEEEELQYVLNGTSYGSASDTPVNPRRKKAHFTFNESAKTLTIHFIEKVDWKAMN